MRFLAVDPGEDVGWVIFEDDKMIDGGTTKMWTFADHVWAGLQTRIGPFAGLDLVVCEDFRIYPWEAKSLSWDPVRTARLIGALTFMCRVTGTEFVLQPAKIKERAIAGGAEHYFVTPLTENRHQNDAAMHASFWWKTNQTANKKTQIKRIVEENKEALDRLADA